MSQTQQYNDLVAAGGLPHDSRVPLDDFFANEKGEIRNLVLAPVGSVARIGSKRGTVRANHWHRTDWHYAIVEYGKVLYFEREVGSSDVPEPRAYGPGDMFYTPPGREHAMLFAEDTVIYTFAKNRRTHDEHEADVVRVDGFVTAAVVDKYLP